MSTASPNRPGFTHIRNSDGTITSVCNRCPLTIARTFDAEDLVALESRHVCQAAERRQVVRLVHRTYDSTVREGDRLASRHRKILNGRGPGLSQSAKVELIRAHLFSHPCHGCAKSVEHLSPNDERVCFRCHLSLKDRWKELAGIAPPSPKRGEINRSHKLQFYSDDEAFLDTFTRFISAALKAGNAVIVAATESHRNCLFQRLQAHGLDIAATVEEGRYVPLDVGGTLSTFIVDDCLDPVRFWEAASALVAAAAKAARGERPRVSACGECAPLLWAKGRRDAAIRLEQLWDEIAKTYDVDILCGYPGGTLHGEQGRAIFQRICAEHSAIYAQ
ncbi:MAG: MEDS domain-containing protein [Candidatus Korobacteraceae bacterium]